jgi:hypothetical protein
MVPLGAVPSSSHAAVVPRRSLPLDEPWRSLRLVAWCRMWQWCLVMEEISSRDENELKKSGGRLLKKSCLRENVWLR